VQRKQATNDRASRDLWAQIQASGLDAGLAGVGVTTAAPFPGVRDGIVERKAAGMNAGMHFTFGNPERSTDVCRSFPWAQSLIAGSFAYVPASGSPAAAVANHGRVARFATADHYVGLRRALTAVTGILRLAGYEAEIIVDDNRLVDRAAAVRAGVGWWGKNSMVLAPGYGPWLLLGSVATDAILEPSPPMIRDCGTCSACLPACPTGALVAPGVLDARLCLAYWLQAPGSIPLELREAMDDRIYGCDDCIEACPPGVRLESQALPVPRLDLLALLDMTDDALLDRFDHFYVPRRRARFLRRNIIVALGNRGDHLAVCRLVDYLNGPDAMLAAHAAWALGRVGGSAAVAALRAAARVAGSEDVLAEIQQALDNYP